MKNNDKTNVMRILDGKKIPYTRHTYEPDPTKTGTEIAGMLGETPEKVFKTLVTQGKTGRYYVFVIPVAEELDLKKAAKAVGAKSVEMIHVKEINKITGYIRGGCSPVGMKKQYVTTFHETAESNPVILVSGGKIGTQIACKPEDLREITRGQFADVIKEH